MSRRFVAVVAGLGLGATALRVWLGHEHGVKAQAARAHQRQIREAKDTGGKDVVGGKLYGLHCAVCHGEDRRGQGSAPNLVGVRVRLGDEAILARIHNGKGKMPAFPQLTDANNETILRFLGGVPEKGEQTGGQVAGAK